MLAINVIIRVYVVLLMSSSNDIQVIHPLLQRMFSSSSASSFSPFSFYLFLYHPHISDLLSGEQWRHWCCYCSCYIYCNHAVLWRFGFLVSLSFVVIIYGVLDLTRIGFCCVTDFFLRVFMDSFIYVVGVFLIWSFIEKIRVYSILPQSVLLWLISTSLSISLYKIKLLSFPALVQTSTGRGVDVGTHC